MLRESGLAGNTPIDLAAITDRTVDPLLPAGRLLLDLTDAALSDDDARLATLRTAVADELGFDGLVDIAAVFATFEMMNRVADATGIPIGRGRLASTAQVRAAAGLDAMRHA